MNRLNEVLNRITDSVLVLDAQLNCVYLNEVASVLFNIPFEQLAGRNILEAYPTFANLPIYQFIQQAKISQLHTCHETYFSASDSWFENHIYPSSDGFTIIGRDISKQKKADDELRRNTQLLEVSQSIAKLGGWELDLATSHLFWTAETYRIHDTSPQEFNPTVDAGVSYFLPESRRIISEALQVAIERGEGYDLELETFTTKGRLITVRTTCKVTMKDGIPAKLTGIFQDITERKQAEMELRKAENHLRTILETEPECVKILNKQGELLEMNPAGLAMIEADSLEEVKGKKVITLVQEPYQQVFDKLIKEVFEGKVGTLEFEMVGLKGTKRWLATHAVPMKNIEGKIEGLLSVTHDITERREAEEKLLTSLKETADYKYAIDESSIVAIANHRGIITHVNDNFCKISQYSREELIGRDHRMINFGHTKEFLRDLWRTINSGKIWRGEIKNQAKDGSFYWVNSVIVPFIDGEGKPFQYLTIRTDITERKNAQLLLEAQNVELQKINAELDRFVYSISHDLRSPLTSILGLTYFIEEDTKEPETLEHIQMIQRSIRRLDDFIKDILGYSHNKRMAINTSSIDFQNLIKNTIESVQYIEQARNIRFEINIDADIPFYSDRRRLDTVFGNLIGNAIKYYNPKQAHPFISISVVTFPEKAEITIADNGIGIAQEYLTKIFDMFFRVSSHSTGSGIGLYVVKEIIINLKGTISVESALGIGTKFSITLTNLRNGAN